MEHGGDTIIIEVFIFSVMGYIKKDHWSVLDNNDLRVTGDPGERGPRREKNMRLLIEL